MRAFVENQRRSPTAVSTSQAGSSRPTSWQDGSGSAEASHFEHDFSRIPLAGSHRSDRPLPFLDTVQRSFGHHDISQIRAHTDSRSAVKAWTLGAEAFACGSDVTFSRPPSLHTAAHEAAHVVQQRTGVEVAGGVGHEEDAYERHADEVADRVVRGQSSADLLDAHPGYAPPADQTASRLPVVQLRRIPPNVRALLTAASGGNGANFYAHSEGALLLINRAMDELTHAERVSVLQRRRGGLTEAQFDALPRRERRSRHVEAILALFPNLQLGDPSLIDTGPRPLTADAANITKVVTHAEGIFAAIASGAQDANLTQVFGAGSIAAAKAKYAQARTWMNTLHGANKILTDRSGSTDEMFQGGLTGFQEVIRVSPSVIDNPDDHDSIVTLLHESMHAGNADIDDNGYIDAPQFTTRSEADKLLNAAHYEVVPWRILNPTGAHAFPVVPATVPPTFQTFIPAGTTVGSVTAALPTAAEQGAKAASDQLEDAWALGLNLHLAYVHLYRTPADWTLPQPSFGGMRLDQSLPFWSKVQKLTIHRKTVIDPASPDPAKHPVSQIDIALSEGLTRKLSLAGGLLDPLQTQADILAFETAHSSTAERSAAFPGGAHTNANAERDFLLKLAVRDSTVAPVTGTLTRDLRVVRQLDSPSDSWSDILAPRNPASFAD
jgi:hypothetical protein